MPRLDPPMKWSWVEPSSCRGTHPQPPRAKPFTGFVPRAPSQRRHGDGVLWLGGTLSWRFGGWPVTCSDPREGCRAGQARSLAAMRPHKSMTQTEVVCMEHPSGGLVGGQRSSERRTPLVGRSTHLVGRCGRAVWQQRWALLGKA